MANRQDKATTERHAKTLRELIKQSDNKTCADCKRNDPRWASWNLGVFICIRCSGIHRSMGTHISKVKSVDLDVWTEEQMASIQKWGNRRANAYWEAHLRAGHTPPDHKMDSFIRSKYDSKRWAMEGPPPEDPSVLDTQTSKSAEPASLPAQDPPPAPIPASHPAASITSTAANVPRLPAGPQLLSAARLQQTAQPAVAQQPVQAPTQQRPEQQSATQDLFSLDFHAPASASPPPAQPQQSQQDVKDQIMSLFSSAPAAQPHNPFGGGMFGAQPMQTANMWGHQYGGKGMGAQQPDVWGTVGQIPQQAPQPTSMMGSAGVGMWGANSGWSVPAAAPNIWGTPATSQQQQQQQQPNMFANDMWGTPATTRATSAKATGFTAQKDDAFADIWGGFK